MRTPRAYLAAVIAAGVLIVALGAPSWAALAAGIALAMISGVRPPAAVKHITVYALQLGVVALGAGMNLVVVARVGAAGAAVTAVALTITIALALSFGRALAVRGQTPLLIGVGTAICGGSAIAAVASVTRPREHELSVSLAVVFILNAVGLFVFPLAGHALGLSEPVFGRWAALAIHDTSSVVGAGLAYGPVALSIATTTKLARALWIVPVTIAIAVGGSTRGGGGGLARLRNVRWPWFILGFIATAAAFTWLPAIGPAAHAVVAIGQRALVLALFLIGLGLSRDAVAAIGPRPLVLGVVLWMIAAAVSLPLAAWAA
jgi:uncharacterized integral membrane protein (TIGR00698 family)